MNDNIDDAGKLPAYICPHCGVAGEVNWYNDAEVRYRALTPSDDTIPVDGSTFLVIRYDDAKLVCDCCGEEVGTEGREIRITPPFFHLDPDALERGFAADRKEAAAPLSLLPGGDLETFGEFAESVIAAAQHRWSAIQGPEGAALRLQPLFPNGEQLLPIVSWADRPDVTLGGRMVTRDALVTKHDRGLASASVDAALILCGFAVDAANEILRQPQASVDFAD